ncbi:MAG TPA: efflux RND transporter periplasmic adaptor subunit [Candidatus Aminicenantes bacterium]|nr:efflux RND transporter periplasmic adaptor subunit [Candidatus Aminicenantes bacterium]
MKTPFRYVPAAALALTVVLAGCRPNTPPAAAHADEHGQEDRGVPTSVTLTPAAVAAADIRTATAAFRPVARRFDAPGELEWNARRVVHVTARTAGRLERVAAVVGDRVREGQVLAELYSPGYLTLQAEYLQAGARVRRHAGDAAEEAPARAVLNGARERLAIMGLTDGDIAALDAPAEPRTLLPVRAPLGGTVVESGVFAGDAVELGASLFRLADPSVLWARLQIRERDLGAVAPGAEVVLRTQAYPGETFRGRLVLVGDVLDAATRTVEGRVEVPNPGGRLKAGMYIDASVRTGSERPALVVPEESVQDDEGSLIVFARTGERTFARRAVRTGERFDGLVEVLDGLAEGEAVVTSGAFLLRSEIRKGGLEDEHGHR